MNINNPYSIKKKELIIKLDRENDLEIRQELELKIKENEYKSREFIDNILNDLKNKQKEFLHKVRSVKEYKKTLRQQYQEAKDLSRLIQGYRTAKDGVIIVGLVNEIRDLKSSLRKELGI